MAQRRTDLAVEAHQLWREGAGEGPSLPGVRAEERERDGFPVTAVTIGSPEGAQALGKPEGVYVTIELDGLLRREEGAFARAVSAVSECLRPLLPQDGPALVVGLGNRAVTPDLIGPLAVDHLLVTRHLGEALPGFRSVSGIGAGVLGTTGMEAAEWIRGAADWVKPAAVVVADALAARSLDRLCSSIQISDTGLIPGSGVGNHRMALNREGLGVPVVSVGIPTVVGVETAAKDLLSQAGGDEARIPELRGRGLFVTPDHIDVRIRELAKVTGYGLDLALQPGLEMEDLEALLA